MIVDAAAREYLPDPVESLCIPLPHLEEIPARVTAASSTPTTQVICTDVQAPSPNM
jgi:hypothetical protein